MNRFHIMFMDGKLLIVRTLLGDTVFILEFVGKQSIDETMHIGHILSRRFLQSIFPDGGYFSEVVKKKKELLEELKIPFLDAELDI